MRHRLVNAHVAATLSAVFRSEAANSRRHVLVDHAALGIGSAQRGHPCSGGLQRPCDEALDATVTKADPTRISAAIWANLNSVARKQAIGGSKAWRSCT